MKTSKHPNGFVINLLYQFCNGMRLRYHQWSADRSERADPHDHRTWFISIPLWGMFLERRYQEIPGQTSVYRCRQSTDRERLDIIEEGQSDVRETSRHIRYPLIPYFCSEEVIHSYKPLHDGFAASLVLFGKPKGKIPRAWIADKYKKEI